MERVSDALARRPIVKLRNCTPGIPPTVESGATFEENAKLKAVEASRHFDGLVLADDSGIEVDALGGAPGVLSRDTRGKNDDDEKIGCDCSMNCAA